MTLTELRRRCEARLDTLDLPVPFEVGAFCRGLAAQRGRAIMLRLVTNAAGPHGLWLAAEGADIIFYQKHTSPAHQHHIILHELSHLLCGHQPELAQDMVTPQRLLPDIRQATVRGVLSRSAYSNDEEREAELLASLILERSAGLLLAPVEAPDGQSEELVQRLATALGDRDA